MIGTLLKMARNIFTIPRRFGLILLCLLALSSQAFARSTPSEQRCYRMMAALGFRWSAISTFSASWERRSAVEAISKKDRLLNQTIAVRPEKDERSGFMGKLHRLEQYGDYLLAVLELSPGVRRLIFLPLQDVHVWVPHQPDDFEIDFVAKALNPYFVNVDVGGLRHFGLEQEFKNDLPQAEHNHRLSLIRNFHENSSVWAAKGFPVVLGLWVTSMLLRHTRWAWPHVWPMEHGSNFLFGIIGLPLWTGTFSVFWFKQRKWWLILSALSYLSLNAAEEIKFPWWNRLSYSAQQQVGSDWGDFSSGVAVTLLYVGVVSAVEFYYRRKSLEEASPLSLK